MTTQDSRVKLYKECNKHWQLRTTLQGRAVDDSVPWRHNPADNGYYRSMELKDNTVIVVLGASGDLAKKKTVSRRDFSIHPLKVNY